MPDGNVVLTKDPTVMLLPIREEVRLVAMAHRSNGRVVGLDDAECFVETTYDIESGKCVVHIRFTIGIEVTPGEIRAEDYVLSLAMNGKKHDA